MTKVLLSHPPRPASHNSNRAMVWVRKNLFSSWSNSLLTIGCIWLMWELIPPLLNEPPRESWRLNFLRKR